MHRLEQIHEMELRLPPEAIEEAARRLGVTQRSVSGRFGEHARRVERTWDGVINPALLPAATTMPDFKGAAESLRTAGFDGPSIVIERLLLAAPGPAARTLRAREAVRRFVPSNTAVGAAA